MSRLALIGVFSALLLTACGGNPSYNVDKTKSCLSSEDAQIDAVANDDLVASTATGGAFVATLGDNWVTVAFGAKPSDAEALASGYVKFARPNVRNNIQDVLERYDNAVLLWHEHPESADLALVTGCLK